MGRSQATRTDARETIAAAAEQAGLGDRIQLVGPHRYLSVLIAILEARTKRGRRGLEDSWWWESLRDPVSVRVSDTNATLRRILPCDESVWLLIENFGAPKKRGHHWLYRAIARDALNLILELPYCEYYLVSPRYDWLVCENHHGLLIASGAPIAERLADTPKSA